MSATDLPVWISEREVSRITGDPLSTIRNRRCKRIGIPYYKSGRAVRYRLDEVLRYMEDRRVEVSK